MSNIFRLFYMYFMFLLIFYMYIEVVQYVIMLDYFKTSVGNLTDIPCLKKEKFPLDFFPQVRKK